ncbi:TPA: site-specific DNA-methyltransferase [Vibrio parahaemolyticus]|uniref:DNA methyltransferase n=1 Tax=Vibrio alginolyticus TaxID=663 RepID=UPI00215F6EF8|nr:site-specific DNA-methyltransferase [Vibrio alginolyticus]MCS0212325.1 site-specific DNA-methyltransferase [Vibrio alginolyticus]
MANEEQQTNVEKYEFEPIKGYPMLNWKGKRPFRSTQYFPAQLKEVYGQEDESGWINKIFWGDNLQVMSHLLKNHRGKINLIYIDPPFDSKADYHKKVKLKGKKTTSDYNALEEKQYTDIWSNDDYLQFMYERLILAKELLSDRGAIVLHVDQKQAHRLRMILDEVFGQECFRNEIIWHYGQRTAAREKRFDSKHDNLYLYSKSDDFVLNDVTVEWSYEDFVSHRHDIVKDENGEEYVLSDAGNGQRYRRYVKDIIAAGKPLDTVWDLPLLNSSDRQRTGYPTQKPNYLLERIIKACSFEGDIVFDFFMGSGTTLDVAASLNRKFIGADINLGSVQVTTKRLIGKEKCNAFEVYNVNNYEIFKNPAEAKDLLIEALEIQKLDSNVVYDGEKDGFKVKIMPVNRIATKEDLNELVSNFPYKHFEERKATNPNKPVEEIMLVCMGHEPGLGATLENECGYKLKVEVVDILRDKSDLTFKYDSEAVIKVQEGKLIVEAFYPRNLLQKLSQQKDDVAEWREMVESIMIDWNYDGAVMEPVVIDIPDKNEFVAGEYGIPQGASNIKIKITDLLSESYEEVIAHG